jgi:ribose transport system substrate-binding protein
MKKTKLIAIVVAVLMAVALFAACSAQPAASESAAESEVASSAPASESVEPDASDEAEAAAGAPRGAGNYDYTLGIIQPGPEFYYQTYADSVRLGAEHAGMTATILLSQYSAETEISNVEDLISQGVDAIACFSVSSETAQIDAQLCNEAGIPLFLMSSAAGEGPGEPTCSIGNSFYEMGSKDGEWVLENITEPTNILEIQGQLGQGIAEEISRGFEEAIASNPDLVIVKKDTANWKRDEAISMTEDAISSGLDFNLVFVHNEDMCAGVVSVLEENDLLNNPVQVVTQNGSDPGIEMIKAGQVLATCANPASYVGGDVVVQILKYFDGQEVPAVYESPVFIIDETNVNDPDLVTWDTSWAIARVDEYFDGTYE